MFAVRCTRKLLERGAPKVLDKPAPPTTVLGDWYANIVVTRAEHLVVCISEKTLLPVVVTAKDVKHLPERLSAAVRTMLAAVGVSEVQIESELLEMRAGYLATTQDRRVLGCLNDFVFHFKHGAGSFPELSNHERALRLARMPCSILEYAFPSEATLAAFSARQAIRAASKASAA